MPNAVLIRITMKPDQNVQWKTQKRRLLPPIAKPTSAAPRWIHAQARTPAGSNGLVAVSS
jgi:hypothetical protein